MAAETQRKEIYMDKQDKQDEQDGGGERVADE